MLKILTSKYRADLIVISLIIVGILYHILASFWRGFTNQDIINSFLLTIPIGILIINSEVRDEPFINTSDSLKFLSIFILFFGGFFVINQIFGMTIGFLYIIGLFALFYYLITSTSFFKPKQQLKPSLYQKAESFNEKIEKEKFMLTKETQERIKLGEERRTILNNLGITYEPNDNRGISLLTDDEFNSLIKNLQDQNGNIIPEWEKINQEYDKLIAAGLDHYLKNFHNKFPNSDKNSLEFNNLRELLGRKGYLYDDDMLRALIFLGELNFLYH
jgi:hypothetical protein